MSKQLRKVVRANRLKAEGKCYCGGSSAQPACSIRQPGRMNKAAYEQCIAEDIEVLHQLPQSLERDHIEQILRHSIKVYYGE